jgi:hypothetical protein
MSRARLVADPALALAVLAAPDRAAVLRWLSAFGLEADELQAVPPLRLLVDMLATLTLAAQMPELGRESAFREASRVLGTGDLLRSWYRWHARAVRQVVRPAGGTA